MEKGIIINDTTELTVIATQAGLDPNKVENLLSKFAGYLQEARKVVDEAKKIEVTDETQTDLMAKAHNLRMTLRDIRTKGVEPTRFSLKEQSLREGKAIDGMSNIIKALIIPFEEYLEKQEKFAEYREQERVTKRLEERLKSLTPYVDNVFIYNVKDMTDEVFNNLLESSRTAFEAKKDAEAEFERGQLAKEKADREEQERIRKENEILKQEAIAKEKELIKIKEEQDKRMAKEKEDNQKILDAEKKKREDAEAKVKEQELAKQKEEEAEKTRIRIEEEAKRKALLAPDKEKLIDLAGRIALVKLPNVESMEAGNVIDKVESDLLDITNYIMNESKKL